MIVKIKELFLKNIIKIKIKKLKKNKKKNYWSRKNNSDNKKKLSTESKGKK